MQKEKPQNKDLLYLVVKVSPFGESQEILAAFDFEEDALLIAKSLVESLSDKEKPTHDSYGLTGGKDYVVTSVPLHRR